MYPMKRNTYYLLENPLLKQWLSRQCSRKIASLPILGGTLGIPEPKNVGKHTLFAKPIPQAVALA